ncbi:MAG: DHHA1 domain-containing protein [Myxococcota bacterium]|nr:DHHA1 domain-containing protein [Myxococcota bacterium]
MSRYCFYHAGCPDGFGAAFAVWKAWGDNARYVARGHDDAPLDSNRLENAIATFVDMSPSNDEMRALATQVQELTVLDHHVTARDRYELEPSVVELMVSEGHRIHFDMSHSGAILAWQHFHPDQEPPALLRYVEDQDLWNWALPDSEKVNAALTSYPRSFDAWSELIEKPIDQLVDEGESLVRANQMQVKRNLTHTHMIRINSRRVEAVNAHENKSAIGHAIAERARFEAPWACVYRVTGDRVNCTLYSIGDFDVASIAVSLGGGGHRNAAGFSVKIEDWISNFL